jgi:hypothetical protein
LSLVASTRLAVLKVKIPILDVSHPQDGISIQFPDSKRIVRMIGGILTDVGPGIPHIHKVFIPSDVTEGHAGVSEI